jgi:hypothetical protein
MQSNTVKYHQSIPGTYFQPQSKAIDLVVLYCSQNLHTLPANQKGPISISSIDSSLNIVISDLGVRVRLHDMAILRIYLESSAFNSVERIRLGIQIQTLL